MQKLVLPFLLCAVVAVGSAMSTGMTSDVVLGSTANDDFARRCAAPAVVRCFNFDSDAQLANRRFVKPYGYDYLAEMASPKSGNVNRPYIDYTTFASGGGALRMDVPSQSGPDGGGDWYGEWSYDGSVLFGANSTFYVQWRQRFSKELLDTLFLNTSGRATGPKLALITAGDIPPGVDPAYPNGHVYASCEKIEVVVEMYSGHRFPMAYNECNVYRGFYEKVTASGQTIDWKVENAMPQGCLYSVFNKQGYKTQPIPSTPGCFNLLPDQWYTFQVEITLGPRDRATRRFLNSSFKLWGAPQGRPSQLIIDWNPTSNGYFALADGTVTSPEWFGSIYLMPYITGKDNKQVHAQATVWYDELIISRQRIPDPQ
ncbi:MAG TPA: hypothetical protein VJQ83_02460 [Tepidiformaceae bacterium]|nr:hypothetical protein [Tepidiformaceae bacterium]